MCTILLVCFKKCINHHPTPLVILAKNLDGNDLHQRSHSLPVSSFLSTIGPGRSYYPVSWAWGGWGVRQNIVVQSDSHIQLGQWCTDWICKLFSILEIFCDLGLGMDKMKPLTNLTHIIRLNKHSFIGNFGWKQLVNISWNSCNNRKWQKLGGIPRALTWTKIYVNFDISFQNIAFFIKWYLNL